LQLSDSIAVIRDSAKRILTSPKKRPPLFGGKTTGDTQYIHVDVIPPQEMEIRQTAAA